MCFDCLHIQIFNTYNTWTEAQSSNFSHPSWGCIKKRGLTKLHHTVSGIKRTGLFATPHSLECRQSGFRMFKTPTKLKWWWRMSVLLLRKMPGKQEIQVQWRWPFCGRKVIAMCQRPVNEHYWYFYDQRILSFAIVTAIWLLPCQSTQVNMFMVTEQLQWKTLAFDPC